MRTGHGLWGLLALLLAAGLAIGGCGSSSSGGGDSTNGTGTEPVYPPPSVTEATSCTAPDVSGFSADTLPFSVVRAIPCNGATGIDPHTAVVVFVDAEIDPATVNASSFVVTDGSGTVAGQYYVASDAGNTVLFFLPTSGFAPSSTVSVSIPMAGGMQETTYGSGIDGDTSFSFDTAASYSGTAAAAPLGFDGGWPAGVECAGDCAILTAFGDGGPVSGGAAYISTGEWSADFSRNGVVSNTPALDEATTVLVVHNLPATGATLTFTYDFISDEFPEFVNAGFNDVFLLAAVGPGGAHAEIVNSVDLIGAAAVDGTFPELPVDSDVTQHSGKLAFSADVSALGSPLTLYLLVSDVGDTIYPTVVMIDNIQFQ